MKTFTVTVRVKGGAWRGMRRSFDVQVDAQTKDAACDLAMDRVEKEQVGRDFESMTAKARISR